MSKIPIRNVYAMLAYASRETGLLDDQAIGACDFERPLDLVGRLLDASMRRLRRRGLHREYIALEEQGCAPRGSIDINRTVTRLLHVRSELAWNVDELLPDTPHNRVIKAALRVLLTAEDVPRDVRKRLRNHVAYLGSVRDVPPRDALTIRIGTPRALPEYRSALQLSRLLLEHLLPDIGQSGARWRALLEDPARMGTLFEKFVRGFAAFELHKDATVKARQFSWDAVALLDGDTSLLPMMVTDVFMKWHSGAITVCECKFYERPLVQSQWSSSETLISAHLYQLMSYLRAAERVTGVRPEGLLLYAMTEQRIDCHWKLEGYPFRVATVDLSRDWADLRIELLDTLRRGELQEVACEQT